MVGEWRDSTWGEEISLEYGKALRSYQASSGQFRVFGSNRPIGWTFQPLAPGPGVILGRKGAYRGVQYSHEPFFVIDTAYYVVPKSDLDFRWIYYAIQHYKLGEINDGSPIPSTTRSAVYIQDLQVPPLPEQRAIAHILGTLDDKIELNRRMNETLEAMARALFQSWFVNFDPVRAKAEGRDTGLPAHIADLFPDSFEDSELGEIPKGWKVATLGEVVGINVRSITKDYPYRVIQYVDISSVNEGTLSDPTEYDLKEAPSRAKRLVQNGDTIWSTVRPNRKSYLYINDPVENLVVSTGFVVLTPRLIPPTYLYAWVTTDTFVDYLAYNADGSAYPAVLPGRFASASILVPPDAVLDAFEDIVGTSRVRVACACEESRTLAALRDALLPRLISGELRVKDAERLTKETVS